MRLLTWLRRFFPDDQNRLSAYGDLVEEHEALTRMGGRVGLRFWWRALRLTVGYGIWARLRSRRVRRSPGSGRWRGGGSTGRSWVYELRETIRSLMREPLFTGVSALSIAVGIGSTTVALSVVDVFFLRSLPGIEEPDRAVELW